MRRSEAKWGEATLLPRFDDTCDAPIGHTRGRNWKLDAPPGTTFIARGTRPCPRHVIVGCDVATIVEPLEGVSFVISFGKRKGIK